jgi:hypothetical protein
MILQAQSIDNVSSIGHNEELVGWPIAANGELVAENCQR